MLLKFIEHYKKHRTTLRYLSYLTPIFGVWLFGWDVFPILFLFHADSFITSLFLLFKLSRAKRSLKLNQVARETEKNPFHVTVIFFLAFSVAGFLMLVMSPAASELFAKTAPVDGLTMFWDFGVGLIGKLEMLYNSSNPGIAVLGRSLQFIAMVIFLVFNLIFVLPFASIAYFMSLNMSYLVACLAVIWHQIVHFKHSMKAIRDDNLSVPYLENQAKVHLVRMFLPILVVTAITANTKSAVAAIAFISLYLFLEDIFYEPPPPQRTGLPQSWINRKTK